MKKVLAVVLIVLLACGLAGCGDNGVGNDSNLAVSTQNSTTISSVSDISINVETDETDADSLYSNIDGGIRGIRINYKKGVRKFSATCGSIYCTDDESLTSLVCASPNSYTGGLEEVLDFLIERFTSAAYSYARGDIEDSELEIKSTEKVVIAGYDSIKFTGTINNRYVDCFTYGYTFMINDVPCMVLGFVSTVEQEQELIDEVIKDVDAMAKTIRVEE